MLNRIIKGTILFLPATAFAAGSLSLTQLDVQDMMLNLRKIIDPFMLLMLTISLISGIVFILKALLTLKSFSMPLTQATKPGELSGPLIYLLVGSVLIYIPASTDVLSKTIFGTGVNSIFVNQGDVYLGNMGKASDQLLGYAPASIEGQWAVMIDTIVLYMEFIGFIAFLRGWFIVAHAGQPGTQPGSISKGLIHIIGGILAINFLPLVEAVHNSVVGTG